MREFTSKYICADGHTSVHRQMGTKKFTDMTSQSRTHTDKSTEFGTLHTLAQTH